MSAPALRLYDAQIRRLAAGVPDLSQPGLDAAEVESFLDSPLCGDQVYLQAQWQSGRYLRLSARAEGCVFCLAATRVVTTLASGQAPEMASQALQALEALWQAPEASPALPDWSSLAVFEPLRGYRNRRHCVRLPFLAWCALAEGAEPPG